MFVPERREKKKKVAEKTKDRPGFESNLNSTYTKKYTIIFMIVLSWKNFEL